jgi:uncharacterized repeat protein (TIGR01451 family)
VTSGYMVQPGVGGRLAVIWQPNAGVVDIGGVESVTVGGADITVADLAGVADLTAVTVTGSTPNAVFHVTPSANVAVNVTGGSETVRYVWGPSIYYFYYTLHGGSLTVDTAGTTGAALQASKVDYPSAPMTSSYYLTGGYTFADRQPVSFTYLSSVAPVSTDPSIVVTGAGDVVAGGPVTYTVTVSNASATLPAGLPEAGITVTDLVPPTLTGVTYTAAYTGGARPSLPGEPAGFILPVGATIILTVTGTLAADATGTLTYTATVGVSGNNVDLDPTNNTSTVTQTINPSADLTVRNTAAAPSVHAGDLVTYSVVVGLAGNLDAQLVTLTDALPDHTTFVSAAAPAGWTVTPPAVGGTGAVTATRDTLTQGSAPQVFTVVVRVDSAAAAGTVLTSTATVGSAVIDGDPANNTADAVTQVTPHEANLTITNVAGAASAFIGGTVTYTIAVSLAGGDSDARQVTLTDTLPDHTTFVSFAAPAGWTVATPAGGGAGTVTATLDALAQGSGPRTFTLVVRVGADAVPGTPLTDTASVTSSVFDPDTANNSADATTTVMAHLRPAVTGAGPGGAPLVNVFDPATGLLMRSFAAYAPTFRGGVRVAVGDVNGDGVPDVITGPGPGGGPHVKVFSGTDGSLLTQFFAFDAAFTGGVFVAAGDVDGDGRADVIVGAGPGGGPHVKVFSGADGAILNSFFAYAATFRGGVTVAAGDVNRDGKADLVTGAGPGGGPHVKVFSGADVTVLGSFFAFDAAFRGGVTVAAGDFNGDGSADVVTGAGPGGGPHVRVFDGATLAAAANPLTSFFAYDPTFRGGVAVAVADHAGRLDLVIGPGPGGGSRVKVFDGLTPTELDAFTAYDPGFLGGVFVG